MELYQLQYALAVWKNGSFSKAAEANNVTRSALSQQIRKLESELEVDLFIRTTRLVEVTPAGAVFLQLVETALGDLQRAKEAIHKHARAERGTLYVGSFPALGAYGVTECIAAFQRRFQNIRLTLIEAECLNLLEMMEDGKLDAAFLTSVANMRPRSMAIEAWPIATSELVLEVSVDHRFAGRDSVAWGELVGEAVLSPPESSGVRLDLDEALRLAGVQPNYQLLVGSSDTVSAFTAAGVGVSVTSLHSYRKAVHERTVAVPVTPAVVRTLYFARPKGGPSSILLDNLKRFSVEWGRFPESEPIFVYPVGSA